MPRLVITKGPGSGRDFAVGTECVLGRALDVDFQLEDVGASRRHARVARDGDGYAVQDLGSRNGTFVNGNRIQVAALRDGDVIRIGGVEIVFRQADVPGAAPAVPATVPVPAPPAATAPKAAPAAPKTSSDPAKKPLPSVVPTKRRRGVF